jgi:hypothetical protein
VGIAVLPPMETVVLPAGITDRSHRELWEHRHLVMSVVDRQRGYLLVGAAADKANDLEAAVRYTGSHVLSRLGLCCWASVVGEDSRLLEQLPRNVTDIEGQGLSVLGCELATQRCTYIVSETARVPAVRSLYTTTFGPTLGVDFSAQLGGPPSTHSSA